VFMIVLARKEGYFRCSLHVMAHHEVLKKGKDTRSRILKGIKIEE
jgi:hypothetical protein